MDLPAEYFVENIAAVFHSRALATGTLVWQGRPVAPAALARTGLMTVEGEVDDIAAPGQTRAAHDLCPYIPTARRRHLVVADAGHFSLVHGHRWRRIVHPAIDAFLADVGA
jgi:poly(3-hydroxybutyrate) depolymerase